MKLHVKYNFKAFVMLAKSIFLVNTHAKSFKETGTQTAVVRMTNVSA